MNLQALRAEEERTEQRKLYQSLREENERTLREPTENHELSYIDPGGEQHYRDLGTPTTH